eukprot:Skav201992  [mRNA]  locus=scaffold269:149625:152509:+ [translate_table: standard]
MAGRISGCFLETKNLGICNKWATSLAVTGWISVFYDEIRNRRSGWRRGASALRASDDTLETRCEMHGFMAVSHDPDGGFLREAPKHVAADREVVVKAVRRAMEGDPWWVGGIVLLALEEDAQSFRFASSKLHADRDIMLLAVRRNGLALQFAVEEFRDNQEMLVLRS